MKIQSPEDMRIKTGLRIKEHRTRVLKKSQDEVAAEMKLTQKTISAYETGKIYPPLAFFDEFSRRYVADPKWLQTGIRSATVTKSTKASAHQADKIRLLEGKLEVLEKRVLFFETQMEKIVQIIEKVAAKG